MASPDLSAVSKVDGIPHFVGPVTAKKFIATLSRDYLPFQVRSNTRSATANAGLARCYDPPSKMGLLDQWQEAL